MAVIDRTVALAVVEASLAEVLRQNDSEPPASITEATVLVGKDALLDSLGVVSLIVEVEQILETEHGVSVTLANDRAMSERNSPFRTVGFLADHLMAMAAEA